MKSGSSGFLVGGTGHERASKRAHLRTVDRWNADWGALALMVERWLVPLIPFPSYKLCASDRPGAVKGARFARRSEPLTARTDLESYEGEGKGILQPSSHLPTKNPEYPEEYPLEVGLTPTPDRPTKPPRGSTARLEYTENQSVVP